MSPQAQKKLAASSTAMRTNHSQGCCAAAAAREQADELRPDEVQTDDGDGKDDDLAQRKTLDQGSQPGGGLVSMNSGTGIGCWR